MRAFFLALALVGACKFDKLPSLGGDGGGGGDDGGGSGDDACVGIGCNVETCDAGMETSISGTVFMPNGTAPLANVDVYVPASDPGPMPTTISCARCGTLPGNPVAKTRTDAAGRFHLVNVPSGDNIPLVITTGKWRRQIRIPRVEACMDIQLAAADTRLPKNRTEGDMPKLAISTGSADALECVVRKLGIDDAEFGVRGGPEAVHMYAPPASVGGGANRLVSGATFTDSATTLWNNTASLASYDAVLLSCEGAQNPGNKPQSAMDAMKQYADMGGRIFATHFHSIWIGGDLQNRSHVPAVWVDLAMFEMNSSVMPTYMTIDPNTAPGQAFKDYMVNVGASPANGQVQLVANSGRSTVVQVLQPQNLVQYGYTMNMAARPQIFSFETPIERPETDRCGRVVLSDMHQATSNGSMSSVPFPQGCNAGALAPQELGIAYMLFDMQRCNGAPP